MDMPVLLTAPMRFALLDRIPVCIQVQDGDGDCLCWQEFLDPVMTLADIKDALGNQWPPHSKVYVRDSARAAGAGPVRLVAGDLLRIVRPGAPVPAVVPIQVKLARPDLHFRRLDVDGYPDTQTVSGRECLLQPLCPVRLVMYSPVPGPSVFEDVMLSHADRSLGELRLAWHRQDIANLRIVGFPVRNVVGTFPAHNTRRVPIFADTREVGFSLQIRASYSGSMPLHAFIEAIGLSLPDLHELDVAGTVVFDRTTATIAVQEGDVVVLRYAGVTEVCAAAASEASRPSPQAPDPDCPGGSSAGSSQAGTVLPADLVQELLLTMGVRPPSVPPSVLPAFRFLSFLLMSPILQLQLFAACSCLILQFNFRHQDMMLPPGFCRKG